MASKGPPRWVAGSLFYIVEQLDQGQGFETTQRFPKRVPVQWAKESHSDPAMAGVSTAAMTLQTAPSSLTWTCCNGGMQQCIK